MNGSPESLDRLHDIALPPPVPWWPPAPGWYVLSALALALVLVIVLRAVRSRRRYAYRRAALRELAALEGVPAIAELLRRTALAVAPRSVVAKMTGDDWVEWLGARSGEPVSPDVRRLLSAGVYDRPGAAGEIGAVREFAARWISRHRPPPSRARGSA